MDAVDGNNETDETMDILGRVTLFSSVMWSVNSGCMEGE